MVIRTVPKNAAAEAAARSQIPADVNNMVDAMSKATNEYLTNGNLAAYLAHLESLLGRDYSSIRKVGRLAMPVLTNAQVEEIRKIYRNLSDDDRDAFTQALSGNNLEGVKAMIDLMQSNRTIDEVAQKLNGILQTGIQPGNTQKLIALFNQKNSENSIQPSTVGRLKIPSFTAADDSRAAARNPARSPILKAPTDSTLAPSSPPSAAPKPTALPPSLVISQDGASLGKSADASTETGTTGEVEDKESPNILVEHTPKPKAETPTSRPGNTITTNIQHGDHGDFVAFSLLMMVFSAAGGAPFVAGVFFASAVGYSAYASILVDVSRTRTPEASKDTPRAR